MLSFYLMEVQVDAKRTLRVARAVAAMGEGDVVGDLLVAASRHGAEVVQCDETIVGREDCERLHFEPHSRQFLFADQVSGLHISPQEVGLLL
jgi:hypothetical protein